MFADPVYGGNKDFAGWVLIGFPGAQPLFSPADLQSKDAFTGAPIIVQHLGLLVGMIGGAIAAREGRLLALSTVGDTVLRGRTKRIGRIFYASVSALIAAFLAVAGQRFVESERSFGKILVYGIPVWAIELALPVGFAVIAVRLLYRAAETWRDRFAAAALASLMGVLVLLQAYVWPFQAMVPAASALAK